MSEQDTETVDKCEMCGEEMRRIESEIFRLQSRFRELEAMYWSGDCEAYAEEEI